MSVSDVSLLADAETRAFLRRLEGVLRDAVARSDGPAGIAAQDTIAAGGKRLRPLLVYLSCPESGRAGDHLVRAAAAVELIHSATLVHDDVLDRAALRRGRPTVWATLGEAVATATGDFLFARAFALLVETRAMAAVSELAACTLGLARGEALQVQQSRAPETTADAYLDRCLLKTGLLFATACALGGRFGGLPDDALERLRDYGRALGLAFQIADDVLDCAGSIESTGKPLGTDLLDGTTTLPLLLAADRDASVARAIVDGPGADGVLPILARVAECGAIADALALAHLHAARAESALDALDEHLDTAPLRAVVRGVVDREA